MRNEINLTEKVLNLDWEVLFEELKEILEEDGIIEKMKSDKDHYSKWHLEGDIWTHTQMVIENAERFNDPIIKIGALFHDTGKIMSKQLNEKTGRYMYSGHWFKSGNIFREIFLKWLFKKLDGNFKKFNIYRMIVGEFIFKFARIIQLHHYEMFNKQIKDKIFTEELDRHEKEILLKLILADQKGRKVVPEVKEKWISTIEKHKKMLEDVMKENSNIVNEVITGKKIISLPIKLITEYIKLLFNDTDTVYIIPIGIPKSGKTTTYKELIKILEKENIKGLRYGFDDIRVKIASEGKKNSIEEINSTEEYEEVHKKIREMKIDLQKYLNEEIKKFINNYRKEKKLIWIDNTHLTIKYRRRIINNIPNRKNSKFVAFVFGAPLFEILERKREYEISKNYKQIMTDMYYSVEFPFITEGFEYIFVI